MESACIYGRLDRIGWVQIDSRCTPVISSSLPALHALILHISMHEDN